MKTNIIIDGLPLLTPLTGIGRYTFEICRHLQYTNKLNQFYHYGYISKSLAGESSSYIRNKGWEFISKFRHFKKIIKPVTKIYYKTKTDFYDLYWQPNFIPMEDIRAKRTVSTIHDFSFELYANFHPKDRVKYFRSNFYRNIVRSDAIITVSEYTKNEILKRLDFDEDKINVIYHGVRHDIFKELDNPIPLTRLPEKFILYVGSIEPRKNLYNLLKAYTLLDSEIKKKYKLLLVGFKGWQNSNIMKLIEENKSNIFYKGYIDDNELAILYNLANCFIFPSFYEGFGLPVLEAMACGTPVITSNVSALPEVGGDAAFYVDPYDAISIKCGIEKVLTDKFLQKRMKLKGLKRAHKFSWTEAANKHLKVFNEILS